MTRLEAAYYLERAWRWLVLFASIITVAAVACVMALGVITALLQVLATEALAADCARPPPPIVKRQATKPKPKMQCTCTPAPKARPAKRKPAPSGGAKVLPSPPAPPVCPDLPPLESKPEPPSGGSGVGPGLRALPLVLLPEPPMAPVPIYTPAQPPLAVLETAEPAMVIETFRGGPAFVALAPPPVEGPVVLLPAITPPINEPPPWSMVALGLIAIILVRGLRNGG